MILLTPKSLLRLPEARSQWSEMAEGTSFRRVIPEEGVASKKPAEAKRLIFCSGKVYYDLVKERAKRGFDDSVAIARIEQVILEYVPNSKIHFSWPHFHMTK